MAPKAMDIILVPNKGRLHQETLGLLRETDLGIKRPLSRSYACKVPSLPQMIAALQPVRMIPKLVGMGYAALGIASLDSVLDYEVQREEKSELVILAALGYGHCRLTIAVPVTLGQVSSRDELFAEAAQSLRRYGSRYVGTTEHLPLAKAFTQSAINGKSLGSIKLLESTGATEGQAHPAIGFADFVIDLVQTGETLSDNELRDLSDGVLIHSQSILIGNRRAIAEGCGPVDEAAERILERVPNLPWEDIVLPRFLERYRYLLYP